jgi:anti-sigma factor RsiW
VTTLFSNFGYRPDPKGPVTVVYLDAARRSSAVLREEDLHAYVDAALSADRRADVEARLARDRAAEERASGYRTLNIDLHRLFDCDLPPMTPSLQLKSAELERRLASRHFLSSLRCGAFGNPAALGTAVGRSIMQISRWLRSNPLRSADASIVLGHTAAAIDRSPLAAVAIVAGVIVFAGMTWPMVAGEPPSCADRVEAAAKQVAKTKPASELAERLASVGFMCRVGETERADQLLAQLGDEVRQPRH